MGSIQLQVTNTW